MKNFLLVSGISAALAVGAVAASQTAALNSEIKTALAGYQNSRTQAKVEVRELSLNGDRVMRASVVGNYRKTGSKNTFELKLTNLVYQNGKDGPVTQAKGVVGFNLTKIIPQEDLNNIIPNIGDLLGEIVKAFVIPHGEAASVDAKITSTEKDEAGNYRRIKGRIAFEMDFAKLPRDVLPADVIMKKGKIDLEVDVTKGITFSLTMYSNPNHKSFAANERGLKELVNSLLAGDAKTRDEVQSHLRRVDDIAEKIVEGKLF